MRRLLAWFRAHRIVTWSLRVVLAVYVAHLWLDWTAEREWRQYYEEARRQGVKFALADFDLPTVPEAENFGMLPMFQAAYLAPMGTTRNPFEIPPGTRGSLPPSGNPIKGTPIDWAAWQQHFKKHGLIPDSTSDPIADVLRGLDYYRPALEEWREWKRRPGCRFQVDWKVDPITVRLPMLSTLQGATAFFGWRMRAHLAQHESAAALEDFHDAFQAARALRDQPTAIAGLTRLATFSVIFARIGDGLAEHSWSEAELRIIGEELASVRVWEDYKLAMSSERVFINAVHEKFAAQDWWERSREWNQIFSNSPNDGSMSVGILLSKRRIRLNQLRANRYLDELLARVTVHGIDLDRPAVSGPDEPGDLVRQLRYPVFNLCTRSLSSIEQRYVRAQTQLAQTRLSIGLERYQLKHGVFPETLDELVPDFLAELPLDPWSSKAMQYRRKGTASFLLYSVGKDRKDNGGAIDRTKSETQQRDAVWLYAPP